MPQWWSYALPVLVFATSWLQQKLLTPPSAPSGEKSQAAMMSQQMQIMMPLMFMFFTLQWATGLSVYFIVSNAIRIGQYYLFPGTRSVVGAGNKPAASEAKS